MPVACNYKKYNYKLSLSRDGIHIRRYAWDEAYLELLFKACDVSIRNGGTQSVGGYTQVTC